MVEFEIRLHDKQRLAYFPRELKKILGTDVTAIANCVTVVLFEKGTDIREVIESLKIVQLDLQQKLRIKEKKAEQLVTA